jgi:hypothetical protein
MTLSLILCGVRKSNVTLARNLLRVPGALCYSTIALLCCVSCRRPLLSGPSILCGRYSLIDVLYDDDLDSCVATNRISCAQVYKRENLFCIFYDRSIMIDLFLYPRLDLSISLSSLKCYSHCLIHVPSLSVQ